MNGYITVGVIGLALGFMAGFATCVELNEAADKLAKNTTKDFFNKKKTKAPAVTIDGFAETVVVA
jgi:hypothetical protein